MQKKGFGLSLFLKILLLTTVSFSSCTSTKENNRDVAGAKPFTILEASFENWNAGRPEGGSGTDYRFTAIINTKDNIEFDEVWIREKGFALPLTPGRLKGPATNKTFTFSKGDTIALYATVKFDAKPQQKPGPVNIAGEAIISYRVKGQKAHEAVTALTKKETLPRPQ